MMSFISFHFFIADFFLSLPFSMHAQIVTHIYELHQASSECMSNGYCSRFSQYTQTFEAEFLLWCLMRMCLSIELWANWEEKKIHARLPADTIYGLIHLMSFLVLLSSNRWKSEWNESAQQTKTTAAVATHDHIWWMALVVYVRRESHAQRINVHTDLIGYHARCRSFQLALQSNRTRGSMDQMCVKMPQIQRLIKNNLLADFLESWA